MRDCSLIRNAFSAESPSGQSATGWPPKAGSSNPVLGTPSDFPSASRSAIGSVRSSVQSLKLRMSSSFGASLRTGISCCPSALSSVVVMASHRSNCIARSYISSALSLPTGTPFASKDFLTIAMVSCLIKPSRARLALATASTCRPWSAHSRCSSLNGSISQTSLLFRLCKHSCLAPPLPPGIPSSVHSVLSCASPMASNSSYLVIMCVTAA
mmetsp:Transcript_1213/g.3281  ORF Transcript_1213/g.3281 Transcript_1213/m.3281 type:complete len:212 (+) Transcript_1213:1397-2032(+)